MRALASCLMAFFFVLSPALAGNGGGEDGASAARTEADGASRGGVNAGELASAASKPDLPSTALASELRELRDIFQAQQEQLRTQSDQFKEQQQRLHVLQIELGISGTASASLKAPSPAFSPAITSTSKSPSGFLSPGMSANASNNQSAAQDEPPALRFRGITITPGGYMAAETVWRNRAIGSGINSSFNAVPLPGNNQAHITEFNASGRQSRISMLAQGKINGATIGGYYEMDFLSAGTTSNDNQSNSYTLRQRQFWGQVKLDSGWTVTGGQMWSLVTETKTGVDNRSEATTQTIDAQYNAGFSWARQYGFRAAKNFGNTFWLAAAIEEAQTTVTAHGQNNNFLAGSFGVTGGLYNPIANYAFSAAPDFIIKAVFQPSWAHFEVFGLLTTARDRGFACATAPSTAICGGGTGPTAALAFNDTRNGGGIGANARGAFLNKHLNLGIHFLGGDGIGRYGSVGLPQATVRPNGKLSLIHNYQSLATIEFFTNKLDFYAYVGDEYASRNSAYMTSLVPPFSVTTVGYGSPLFTNKGCWTEPLPGSPTSTATGVGGSAGFVPGSLSNCTNDTKHEMESTLGFWYRFYKGSKGTVQFGMQESYFVRYDWNGLGNTSGFSSLTPGVPGVSGAPHGTDNMVFTSFRYVLP